MPEDFDYYKALKDENYKSLLDNQIQLENARQRAYKNTNASLAAAGMASAGYGQLARQGIEGQYLQGLQNAQQQYQTANANIDQDNYNAQSVAYAGLMSDLDSASFNNQDELNSYLTEYGLMKNGAIDQELFNSKYGADNWGRFNASLGDRTRQFVSNTAPISYNVNEARTNILDNDGKAGTINDELGFLYGNGKNTIPATNGTVVMVKQNNTDGAKYAYLIYTNGGWQQTDSETYNKASNNNKYELYSDKNTKDKYNVTHNGNTTKYNSDGKDTNAKDSFEEEGYEKVNFLQVPQEVAYQMSYNGHNANTVYFNGYTWHREGNTYYRKAGRN